MDGKLEGQSVDHESGEFIWCARAEDNSSCNKREEKQKYGCRAKETKFFADNRKYEVILRLGNVTVFEVGFTESDSEKSARTDRIKTLIWALFLVFQDSAHRKNKPKGALICGFL